MYHHIGPSEEDDGEGDNRKEEEHGRVKYWF